MKEVINLKKENIDEFATAYARSFPEIKLNREKMAEHIFNKFGKSGDRSLPIVCLETNEGTVSAGYGVIRKNYRNGSHLLRVGLVCDVFTDPNFRKQGLFKRISLLAIAREEKENVDFLIGFPIREGVMPGHLSVGWKHIFNMHIWWSFPSVGSFKNTKKLTPGDELNFKVAPKKIQLTQTNLEIQARNNLHGNRYYIGRGESDEDFILFTKKIINGIPLIAIVYIQSSNASNTKILIKMCRKYALRWGALAVVGCWNDTYAKDLFLSKAGMRKSARFQKVIVRGLSNYQVPGKENEYRLSWLDSDTL